VTGYELDERGSIPGTAKNFSLHYHVKTKSGSHPLSDSIGT